MEQNIVFLCFINIKCIFTNLMYHLYLLIYNLSNLLLLYKCNFISNFYNVNNPNNIVYVDYFENLKSCKYKTDLLLIDDDWGWFVNIDFIHDLESSINIKSKSTINSYQFNNNISNEVNHNNDDDWGWFVNFN